MSRYDNNPHFHDSNDYETPNTPRRPGLANIQTRSRPLPSHQQPNRPGYEMPPPISHKSPVPLSPQPFLPPNHHQSSVPENASDFPYQDGSDRRLPLPPSGRGGFRAGTQPAYPDHRRERYQPSQTRPPTGWSKSKTATPCAWLACCSLVVLGLVLLVVLLVVNQPRSLKFDVSSVNLNTVSLDTGNLLSVDLTLLGNFSNPNKRGSVELKDSMVNLYYDGTQIASSNMLSFPLTHGEYKFQDVHLAAGQVGLPSNASSLISKQMESGSVWFQVKGTFRTRSTGLIKYSYWLHAYCTIVLTYPPPGALVARSCTTKR
ncbi:unnamed protein product [Cuscuta epithymum]|uniref:Late embryogenesis abundant protein LEA-2 subgroup domain-containing protein n=1 Tax=Cuscuta epithymum TaxID=186058 RepID=A0AAV0F9A1_9ASTE|nr:unnamed protein product [Cuscuta epithymum]